MENHIQYCYQKTAPVGSAFYYSVLKLPKLKRDTVVAISAFYQELIDCLYECKEPALAHVRLNWWRLEVSKLSLGHPEHPVSLVVQQGILAFDLSPQLFADIIDGIEESLSVASFVTVEDVMIYIMRTAGVRELLIARVVQDNTKIDSEVIYQLTLVLELSSLVQNLRRDVRVGLLMFGEDELKRFHVTSVLLQEFKTTPEIKALLAFQLEKAELAYQKAKNTITQSRQFIHANLMIRCETALRLLREIKASHYLVLENFITLTALKNWWIAQCIYRKVKKAAN